MPPSPRAAAPLPPVPASIPKHYAQPLSEIEREAVTKSFGYTIVGRSRSVISLYTSPTTTDDQIKKIILGLWNARKTGSFSRMIPPTTKGGDFGDYSIVWVMIFSDRQKASMESIEKFLNSSINSKADRAFDRNYAKYIRGEYYYENVGGEEYGSIGTDSPKGANKKYKRLF